MASLLVFLVVRLIPGDPAAAVVGENATAEAYQQARERLGLNDPIHTQYFEWITNAMTGDFGQSIKGPQASEIIASAFPATIELAALATLIGFGFGITLGILAAVNRGGFWDFFASLWTGWNIGVPSFIAGLIYLLIFSVWWSSWASCKASLMVASMKATERITADRTCPLSSRLKRVSSAAMRRSSTSSARSAASCAAARKRVE
ncbi:MAG: ABC transporter permease [Chloroflexi bacterium]|nr:ABC transporter permease [Chloroflexota bacterium]